ncbi:MAG: hypothetical protein Q4D70_09580, partial [bacterium]|nr:hypothetical protein [bacterium]
VYYACSVVPKPTKGHEAFRRYMRFFHAEDDNSLVLMSAFVASLMYYRPGIQRPCWIVDSRHGQSAGKTTFVETACELYDFTPIRTSALQLERNELDLNKRLVSESGRSSRVLLLDNLRGVFDNPVFADLVTASAGARPTAWARRRARTTSPTSSRPTRRTSARTWPAARSSST